MKSKKKRVVTALDGNALGNTLSERIIAVKITAKAIVDLIEGGCEVIIVHGNDPQAGVVNNIMVVLSRKDTNQSNTPPSACVTIGQAYIDYDPQNALREEFCNCGVHSIPVATTITQARMDTGDPALDTPSEPTGHFMTEEQAKIASEKYGYITKEGVGRGYRRVVASPKPAEIVEINAIRSLVDSGQLVIAYGGGGIPITRQDNHLKSTSAVIDRDLTSELLAEELNADFLIILATVERVVISFGRPEEKQLGNLTPDRAHVYTEERYFAPGLTLSRAQIAVKFAESKDGRTVSTTLFEKAKEGIQGLTGTHIH